MKRSLIFFIFIHSWFFVFSQGAMINKELCLLSVIDTGLNTIFDSVINFEKKCEYYNDSLIFTLNFRKIKNFYLMEIESSDNINNVFNYFDPIFGFLYYKNHLFIVYEPDSKKFFKKTKFHKTFQYRSTLYQNTDTLLDIIDDSFTIWSYLYFQGKFMFRGRSSACN